MVFLYNCILILILIAYVPHLTMRGKWHKGLKVQLGFWPQGFAESLAHSHNIWIHAVSVGEVLAIKSFIGQMTEQYPQHQIVLSTVTRTGYELALSQEDKNVKVIYAPFDFSWVVKKYLKAIKPKVYIAAETEIWPNLYRYLESDNVPIVQVNGRLSDRSYGGYKKIRPFMKSALNRVGRFCVQSENDRQRVCALGADTEKVYVTGNLKFDNMQWVDALERSSQGYSTEDMIWVAGSTHPGEERIVLDVFKQIQPACSSLKLILAPRHIERVNEVVGLVQDYGLSYDRLSQKSEGSAQVLIVDTIGQLRSLYSLADIVFVGKTLVGEGGQNILEPAQFAKPIIVGPHMQNFRAIMEVFEQKEALKVVHNEDELADVVKTLIEDAHLRTTLGVKAKQILEDNQGATVQTLKLIGEFITS